MVHILLCFAVFLPISSCLDNNPSAIEATLKNVSKYEKLIT